MQRKTPKLLGDIRDAAGFIMKLTSGKALVDYKTDRVLRQTVERNFEIIGEAINRLARSDAGTVTLIPSYQRIISFRNVLSHGYDLIDDATVWKVIQNELPELLAQVTSLLGRDHLEFPGDDRVE